MSDAPLEPFQFNAASLHGTFDTLPFPDREDCFPITLWHDRLQPPVMADEFDLPIPSDLPSGRSRMLVRTCNGETVAFLSQVNGGSWLELALVKVNHWVELS